MDAVLVDERVVRTAGTCGVGSSSEGGLELRAVHVTQTGVSPKDVLVAAALSSRWFEAPVDAVDAMILDAVDVAPLSDSYTLNEHALTGGDGGPRGWIAASRLARTADGGSTFRTCRGSVDAVVEMCDVGWDVHDEVTRRVEECAAAGVRCMAVAADYRGRSEEDDDSMNIAMKAATILVRMWTARRAAAPRGRPSAAAGSSSGSSPTTTRRGATPTTRFASRRSSACEP